MTFVAAALLLLIAAYAVHARRRHARLQAACVAAFERIYATTSPRPTFDMGYSYGEPVFQLQFANKTDLQAAADANAEFLRAIDELCKNRGRKRQFKAARAVFFQHPDNDRRVVTHCCESMRAQVGKAVAFDEPTRRYGLKTSKVGAPPLPIAHCPWCGSVLAKIE